MSAYKTNLNIEKGAQYNKKITWKDSTGALIDNSAYSARMKIKQMPDNATTELELTNANGGIILGGANGEIDIYISAVDTAALTFSIGKYDLELYTNADNPKRILQGYVNVIQEVTV
jgi:hypothetical protein